MCNCKVVGIGLPFDHPIWHQLTTGCPVHSTDTTVRPSQCFHEWKGRHLNDPECSKCGVRRNGASSWTIAYDPSVQWTRPNHIDATVSI